MMIKIYTSNKLIRFLDRELRRTDLVLELGQNGEIILLLPETDLKKGHILAKRICAKIVAEFDVEVNCGLASFPEQALTFEELVKQAESQFANKTNLFSSLGLEEEEVTSL